MVANGELFVLEQFGKQHMQRLRVEGSYLPEFESGNHGMKCVGESASAALAIEEEDVVFKAIKVKMMCQVKTHLRYLRK